MSNRCKMITNWAGISNRDKEISNWGSEYKSRQDRLQIGVEQLYCMSYFVVISIAFCKIVMQKVNNP